MTCNTESRLLIENRHKTRRNYAFSFRKERVLCTASTMLNCFSQLFSSVSTPGSLSSSFNYLGHRHKYAELIIFMRKQLLYIAIDVNKL